MKLKLLLLSLMLTGCISAPVKLPREKVSVHVTVTEGPMMAKGQRAYTVLKKKDGATVSCDIVLKIYPQCLQHEMRHCLEGDWHPADKPNDYDC